MNNNDDSGTIITFVAIVNKLLQYSPSLSVYVIFVTIPHFTGSVF